MYTSEKRSGTKSALTLAELHRYHSALYDKGRVYPKSNQPLLPTVANLLSMQCKIEISKDQPHIGNSISSAQN